MIGKKEFAPAVFDPKYKAFVIHIATLSLNSGDEMHPSNKAQIAHLKVDKSFIEVSSKYADFADVFLPKLAAELPEHRINNYVIKLIDDWQPPYSLINSLGPVKLETLKDYMKNNLANSFIRPFKSPAKAFIFFDKKPDGRLRLYIDYQDLKNLTMKN